MIVTYFLSISGIHDDDIPYAMLPPDRLARCRRAPSRGKARQIAMAWFLLEYALGRAGQRPELIRSASGKPQLANSTVTFNLSHCDGYVACIVADGCAVGVDVERIRQIPARFYRPYFSPEDFQAAMSSDSPAAWCQAWTQKEAVIKCIGDGWTDENKKNLHVLKAPVQSCTLTRKWLRDDCHICACAGIPDATIVFSEVYWNGGKITGTV